MAIEYEKSCGVIPFRKELKGIKYLLVRNIGGHWEFPKGHVEKGETERETAKREFAEETGLKVKKLLKKAYLEHYFFTWKGRRKSKTVTYFLGQIENGEVNIQEDEIIDHVWLSYRSAMRKLTFRELRDIFKDCRSELQKHLNS
ncbi:MAG: NUDIX domain-containing protein [Patescibacteria group bacterium]|jgi:tRNA nucleotidyltransferase (CCA-adding enzyme)